MTLRRLLACGLAFLISRLRCDAPPAARAAAASRRRDTRTRRHTLFGSRTTTRGIELDFARRLAHALGAPLEIVPVAWDEQISDSARRPYRRHHVGHVHHAEAGGPGRVRRAVPHDLAPGRGPQREDAERWPTPDALLRTSPRIGVKAGTTGEEFVRARRPDENIVVYRRSRDAITELIAYRIDVYVGDAPVIEEAVAQNTGKLVAYPRVVGEQSLAWAFRSRGRDLRHFANSLLERWRADGTLRQVLGTWSKRPK